MSNPSGVHFLRDRRVIVALVQPVRPDELVVEFGAGPGVLTAALAGTRACVLAVERDAEFVARLGRRFADRPWVRVVRGDLRRVPLPSRPYRVVANLPFAVTTAALRRLLDPAPGVLVGADVLVEWGAARRLTAEKPRSAEVAWWAARYELRIARRVPAAAFSPAPRVDAAHLVIRPRPVDPRALRPLRLLLTAAYAEPAWPVHAVLGAVVPRRRAHRIARSTGISPPTLAADLAPSDWAALAHSVIQLTSVTPGGAHLSHGRPHRNDIGSTP